MPIYEYQCINCGIKFDVLVRTPNELIRCTKCASADIKRLISLFGIAGSSSGSGCSTCNSIRGNTSSCKTCTK
ncbi:MAG: zinc ribbon domain-containing protein [Nitrospirota bacterium]